MDKFFHAVHLDPPLCMGCINCLKRCPTEAIRVRNGKAHIIKEYCIDCGECIRICPHHAKKVSYDIFELIGEYAYTIALPPPSLYAQFNNLDDKELVLDALLHLGFDDVFEVAVGAEIVSMLTRRLIKEKTTKLPLISSACPSVSRLIRVRFPNLVDLVSPIKAPIEIVAELALEKAFKKTGLPREKIGIFFISPCPAKVTEIYAPMSKNSVQIDGVFSMSDIYPRLLPAMKEVYASQSSAADERVSAGRIGVSWGRSDGEASGLLIDRYLAADGIENVIKVLEDLEDDKLKDLDFIELNSCSGGCVGGVLAVENPYIAKVKLNTLRKYLPIAGTHIDTGASDDTYVHEKIEYLPVYKLGETLQESIILMQRVEALLDVFPGLDCGCCGAPTCRAHAEDVARGNASEKDCIHILKKFINQFTDEMSR